MLLLTVKQAIDFAGGAVEAGTACDVSARAVYKWIAINRLPRTEYTGETCYAKKLSAASGGAFSAVKLLEDTAPNRTPRVLASAEER